MHHICCVVSNQSVDMCWFFLTVQSVSLCLVLKKRTKKKNPRRVMQYKASFTVDRQCSCSKQDVSACMAWLMEMRGSEEKWTAVTFKIEMFSIFTHQQVFFNKLLCLSFLRGNCQN